MTEKQYKLEQWTSSSLYYSFPDGNLHHSIGKVIARVENDLNSLHNENKQLKQDKTNLHLTMSKERVRYLQFRDKVFDLIDEKIKHYEHKPFSAPVGQPMSVNFDADVDRIARLSELQDLKKELQEWLMS